MAVSKAQMKATAKYERNNYDKILIRIPKGTREDIKEKADSLGESLNEFFVKAVKERIESLE